MLLWRNNYKILVLEIRLLELRNIGKLTIITIYIYFARHIAADNKGYQEIIFLISPQKRGYSLEASCQDVSYEYPQHITS